METDEQEIKYEEKYVAFLDILGFKDLIDQNKKDSIHSIININSSISFVNQLIKEIETVSVNVKPEEPSYKNQIKISYKYFSDCICVSNQHLFFLILNLQVLQFYLATKNIFIRGGLAKGNHFENENIIFSKGLVDAYKLESKKADYPRIIIHDCLVEEILLNKNMYLIGNDGIKFLDFLGFLEWIKDEEQIDKIKTNIRESIIWQVETSKEDKITQKYNWLVEYFNFKVEDEYKIDPSIFKFAYKNYEFEKPS